MSHDRLALRSNFVEMVEFEDFIACRDACLRSTRCAAAFRTLIINQLVSMGSHNIEMPFVDFEKALTIACFMVDVTAGPAVEKASSYTEIFAFDHRLVRVVVAVLGRG